MSLPGGIMIKFKIVPISKRDAVKQQIDEAIWMFFSRRNPVAIHSIVGAAHQVLHDLTNRNCSMIKNERSASTSRKGKEWYRRLNKEYNFFKHAETDKEETINFDPLLHTYYLVDCVYMYRALTGTSPYNHSIFDSWFALAKPSAIGDPSVRLLAEKAAKDILDPNNFEYFLNLIENHKEQGCQ